MKKYLIGILVTLTLILGVGATFLCFDGKGKAVEAQAAVSSSYGFYVNTELVTTDNLSGEGWSYNPLTQTLTLGEEGKSFTFNKQIVEQSNFYLMHTIGSNNVRYGAIIQPETIASDYIDNKEVLRPTENSNRPTKLKIVVKGDVQLGDGAWAGERFNVRKVTSSTGSMSWDVTSQFGGIMWNGDIEISGGGNLQIRSHSYGINSRENKITFTDVTVGIESYGNCMMVGEMVLTNADVTNTSYSIGAYGRDEITGNLINDSANVVSAGTITMKGSHLNAVGTYNRNNTTEPGNSMQDFTALSSRPIYLYDSTVEAKAFIGSGWALYCKDASGNDLGNNLWVRAILSSLHLYDGSYATATAGENGDAGSYDDRKRVDFVGIYGSIYAYGNAGVCGNVYEGSHAASSAILGIKWDAEQDKFVVPNGKITNDHTEYEIDSYYLNTNDPYYQAKNRYLSQYSVNIKFWKQDTLYLRYGENDQPQASWRRDFSSIINLGSTTVNPADYLAYDGKPCSVAVMSGVFTVMLPKNPDVERYYIAQGGHLKLQMKDGANYGTVHVKSSEYYGITIEGNGTIEYLDCEESKYSFTRSISLITVPYICGGSLTVNGGNIKRCKVDGGYNNRVNINGGNVILEGGNLTKHVLDFNKIDGTVDLKNGGLSLRNLNISFNNLELFDGVYYFYTRDDNNLGGLFNYVYVQSEDSYNYYMLPVRESKIGNTVTYNFQRFEEEWRYESGNSTSSKNKKIYTNVGQSVTLEAGQFVKYVVIEPAVLFGFDGLTARLGGSESREAPSDATIYWFENDTKSGTTYLVKQYSTLDYTIENVTADHEFYTYTCEVYKDGGATFMGEFRCDLRVVVIDVSPNIAYVKVGDTITLSATIDKDDRDDWRDRYNVGWQVDKGDGNGWDFIDYFHPKNDYALTVDSEEMLNWKYRAHLYQLIKPIDGPSLPEYDSFEITLKDRSTPSVGSLSVPDYEISGEKGYITATLNRAYTSATTVYWEYSEDDGKNWTTISNHPNLSFMNEGITIVGGGRSWMPSYFMSTLTVKYKNSLDGVKVRCVIDDFQQNKTYYSGVHTISVIQMPEIYLETSDTITVTETDTSVICSCWMFGGDDNILCAQQWQKRVEGSDVWVDIENQTATDYYLLDLTDAAETTYYRCKLTYSFIDGSHADIVRYGKERQVNVVHAPKVSDNELQDTLLLEGESKDFNIEFTRNATNPYVVQWQTSVDGESWENYGDAKPDTDLTCKKLSFDKVTGIGINYYRAKVTATMNEVFFDTYTKTFKVYTARLSTNCDRFAISDERTATLSVTNTYPEEFDVSYEWQYKNDEEWLSVTELGFESANETSILVDTKGKDGNLWRCLVTFTTRDGDFTTQVSTVEITRTYLVSPPFIGAPSEVVVWGEKPYTYLDIDFETSDKDFYQLEYSRDGGNTWKKSGGVVTSQSSDPLDKFNVGTVTADMDGYLYRVHAWRVYSDFNVTMYGYSSVVKLVVHTGKVSTLEELLTAIENETTHIQLLSDITITEPLTFTKYTFFDLNGHVLKQSQNGGSVINVSSASLIITDSAPNNVHTDTTLPVGGVITGGTGTLIDEIKYGGGVYVNSNSTIELRGGTIYNCSADNGGGIYAKGRGNVFIKGGNVVGCTATVNGGGVYCEQSAMMTDGLITNCIASESGGGFYVIEFTMRGGTIKDCQASQGASVYCKNTFYADGGKVYDTVYVGIVARTIENSPLTTAFYDKVTTAGCAYAGMYYAGTSGVIVGGVPVRFLNGTTAYATLIVRSGARAVAPSELCDLDWVNAETRKKYDFTDQVTKTISLRATWSDADNGHTWSTTEIIAKVDADCENSGTLEHWHCNTCGKDYAADKISLLEDITIAAHDHTYSLLIAQNNATCTETGLVAHYECSVCHKLFDEDKVEKSLEELTIAALGHTYGDLIVKVDESCTDSGFAAHYECSQCHQLFDENKVEKTTSELVIVAHVHTYGDLIVKVDESCTASGFAAHYVCSECHNLFDENKVIKTEGELTIAKHAHTCGDLIAKVDESCTETGFAAYYVCSECHKLFDENKNEKTESELVIAAHAHSYGDLIVKVDESCTASGFAAHYECSECHNLFDENKVAKTESELTIDKHAHTYGDLIVKVDESCTAIGFAAHYECSECHNLFDENKAAKTEDELTIDKHAHTYGDLIVKVDERCTETGFAAHYVCSECHKLFDENKNEKTESELVIAAHAHSYGNLIVKVDESCTASGFAAHYECSECHNLFDENKVAKTEDELTVAAHGHAWSTTEIIAEVVGDNCESTGTKAHWHCDACNKDYAEDKTTELTDLTIAATEHNFGDWICDIPATKTEKGHLYRECSSCGAKEEKDINKLSGGCINTSASSFITIDVTLLLAAVLFAIKRKS